MENLDPQYFGSWIRIRYRYALSSNLEALEAQNGARIHIRIKEKGWIRIRTEMKCLIRILIQVMRIRNPNTGTGNDTCFRRTD